MTPFYDRCLHTLAEMDEKTELTAKKIYARLLLKASSPPLRQSLPVHPRAIASFWRGKRC